MPWSAGLLMEPYSLRAKSGVWCGTLVLRETDFVGRVCFPVHEA